VCRGASAARCRQLSRFGRTNVPGIPERLARTPGSAIARNYTDAAGSGPRLCHFRELILALGANSCLVSTSPRGRVFLRMTIPPRTARQQIRVPAAGEKIHGWDPKPYLASGAELTRAASRSACGGFPAATQAGSPTLLTGPGNSHSALRALWPMPVDRGIDLSKKCWQRSARGA